MPERRAQRYRHDSTANAAANEFCLPRLLAFIATKVQLDARSVERFVKRNNPLYWL